MLSSQSNPIPRPSANVNGKTEKVLTQTAVPQPKAEPSSGTSDLLGLDLISSANDEPFGFFASADSAKANEPAVQPKDSKTLEDEEKDFFSQKVPEKSEEKKLTKESILSLYSQAPTAAPLNGFMAQPVNALNQFPTGNAAAFGSMNAPKQVSLTGPPFIIIPNHFYFCVLGLSRPI